MRIATGCFSLGFRKTSPKPLFSLPLIILLILAPSLDAGTVGAPKQGQPEPQLTSLPDYLAMDRMAQLEVILKTRKAVFRRVGKTDLERAKCIAGLFEWTEDGKKQIFNVKGFLKGAVQDSRYKDWGAEEIVTALIQTHLCPQQNTARN